MSSSTIDVYSDSEAGADSSRVGADRTDHASGEGDELATERGLDEGDDENGDYDEGVEGISPEDDGEGDEELEDLAEEGDEVEYTLKDRQDVRSRSCDITLAYR